jgi:hypothetical protein
MTKLVGTQNTDEAKPEDNRIVIETDGEARRNSGAAEKKSRIVEIGALPVDAGAMMLSDPCYVLPDPAAPEQRDPKIWDRMCRKFGDKPYVFFSSYDDSREDSNVLVVNTGGDGFFPVYAELDENGEVAAITIRFLDVCFE